MLYLLQDAFAFLVLCIFAPPSNYVLFNHPPTTTAMSQKPHSTESIASTAIALDWTFTGLAIVVVGLRIYTRTRLINGLGLEDLAISASVVRTHMPRNIFRRAWLYK
jgi:hypothetical protein